MRVRAKQRHDQGAMSSADVDHIDKTGEVVGRQNGRRFLLRNPLIAS